MILDLGYGGQGVGDDGLRVWGWGGERGVNGRSRRRRNKAREEERGWKRKKEEKKFMLTNKRTDGSTEGSTRCPRVPKKSPR